MRSVILVGSIAVNALLASFTLYKGPVLFPSEPASAQQRAHRQAGKDAQPPATPAEQLTASLRKGDSETLFRLIRDLGLPKRETEALLRCFIEMKHEMTESLCGNAEESLEETTELPYWKSVRWSKEEREKKDKEWERRREERERDFKLAGLERPPRNHSYRDRYPGDEALSEERRSRLRQIQADYREMSDGVRETMQGFALKSDKDKLDLLEKEQQKDIEGLLTPAERKEMELRSSHLTYDVKNRFGEVIESETQFLQLRALYQAFEEKNGKYSTTSYHMPTQGTLSESELTRARLQLDKEAAALLGASKAEALARENDPDRELLAAASRRLNLPEGTHAQVISLRQSLALEGQRIAADGGMNAEQKAEALKRLAATARAQLAPLLGAEGVEAYAERSTWVRSLGRGNCFALSPLGGVKSWSPTP